MPTRFRRYGEIPPRRTVKDLTEVEWGCDQAQYWDGRWRRGGQMAPNGVHVRAEMLLVQRHVTTASETSGRRADLCEL